jgi:hypothetical protein
LIGTGGIGVVDTEAFRVFKSELEEIPVIGWGKAHYKDKHTS